MHDDHACLSRHFLLNSGIVGGGVVGSGVVLTQLEMF
jgi:hypothetical protein